MPRNILLVEDGEASITASEDYTRIFGDLKQWAVLEVPNVLECRARRRQDMDLLIAAALAVLFSQDE